MFLLIVSPGSISPAAGGGETDGVQLHQVLREVLALVTAYKVTFEAMEGNQDVNVAEQKSVALPGPLAGGS